MSMLRFQAPDRLSYVRTVTNQIGPDVSGVATKRAPPTFTDANTIFVAKTGANTNSGTDAAPKLTVGAAALEAFISNRPYVAIKDSGVYEEIVGGSRVSIYAMANCRPTIKYPANSPEAYVADAGAITAIDYDGGNDYSLRGLRDEYFAGTINDYQIIDGVHWIASTNGIWYSYLGYTGWYLVAGTAGTNFKHPVKCGGYLYALKTGSGIYRFTTAGIALEVADANAISLTGNDDHLAAVTNVSGRINIRHLTTQGWVLTDVASKSSWYYTAITGFNRMFKVGSDYYLFAHVKDSDALYYGAGFYKVPAMTSPASVPSLIWANTWGDWGVGTNNVATVYDFIQDTGKNLLYVNTSSHGVPAATLYSFDYSVVTTSSPKAVVTPAAFTRVWSDQAETGVFYLAYAGGIYSTSDWSTFTQIATTTNQAPVAIFDADPGRIIISNTWTAGCSPGLYIWRKYVIHRAQLVNGVVIDGANLANVGLYASYANGEHEVAWNCEIKNCTVAGLLDGGQIDQRTKVFHTIIHNCGIGIKIPDFAVALLRMYRCFIHDNQYGVVGVGFSNILGPEIYNSVISANAMGGVWYECLDTSKPNPTAVSIANSILFGNGYDLILKNRSVATAINSISQSVIGTLDIDAHVAVASSVSQADPLLLPNGDVQDIAGGYPFDSAAIAVGAAMFIVTRTPSSASGLDYRFGYLPEKKSVSWKPSNFQSNENAAGEYSESWDGMKRTISLTWPDNYFSTKKEFYQFIDLLRQEDAVFRFGDLDTAGTGWKTQLNTLPTIEECDDGGDDGCTVTTKTNHPAVGINEFSGWYLSLYDDVSGETILIRIVSHNESDGTVPVTFVLDRTTYPAYFFAAEGSTLAVAYLPVKIDKSSAFSGSQFGFLAGADPLTGYSLTLREVEHE